MSDRNVLLKQIGETSFLLDDLRLYLDTHPLDTQALDLFGQNHAKRKDLLKQYADEFEPLTCDCICIQSNGSGSTDTRYPGQKHWTWNDGPVPWDTPANNFSTMMGGV